MVEVMTKDQKLQAMYDYLCTLKKPPKEAWETVLPLFREVSYKKGELFVRAGDVPTKIAFIAQGLMRIYFISEDGKQFNKSFLAENEFITALSGAILGEPALVSIQAMEPTELLTINFSELQKLYEQFNYWQAIGRIITEQIFIRKEKREGQFLLSSAEERYRSFRKESPNLENRIPDYHIASYLGITPVALSRIKKQVILNS